MTLLRQHGVETAKDVVERGEDGHGEKNRAGGLPIPGFGPAKWAVLYAWADAARDEAVLAWSASMSVEQRIEALLCAERAIQTDNRKAIDDLEFLLWCDYVGSSKVLLVGESSPADEQLLVSTFERVKKAYDTIFNEKWAREADREVTDAYVRREEIKAKARSEVNREHEGGILGTVSFVVMVLGLAAGAAWFLFFVVWA